MAGSFRIFGLTLLLITSAPAAAALMNIDSVDRHIESGLHYWPTPFGLSQGATNHYENVSTQSPGNNDPWLVGTPGIFITPPYHQSSISPTVLSLSSRATESVNSNGNQYSIMNYQKNVYEVTFTLDALTPFTLTMASPIYAQGTCTLTSPTNTVQSFSANTSLLYNLNLTPGQWKFAANTIADNGPALPSPLIIGATLAVAPEPSSAVLLAIASAGLALQRRRGKT